MNTDARSQIRLILDLAQADGRLAVQQEIRQIYAERSSEGTLRSGATMKAALRAMEESGETMLKQAMDSVSAIAKDIEAFAMLRSHMESHIAFLAVEFDGVLRLVCGKQDGLVMSALAREGLLRFTGIKTQINRQIEIHRFTFTEPFREMPKSGKPVTVEAKGTAVNKGGKPLARHWDAMWAAIAAMLYAGDLKPASQADIERAMKEWFAGRDHDIGDTVIRERARALWSALQDVG